MRIVPVVLIAMLSMSCSVALQNGVRSAGYNCSTSYAWAAADLVLAGSSGLAASRGVGDAPYILPAQVLAGTLLASAAIGAYKAHHCSRYVEQPEVIAQMQADYAAQADAQALAAANAAATGGDDAAAPDTEPEASGNACPDGQLLGGQSWDMCFTCPEGAGIGGFANRECICPEGTSSNGTACVTPNREPAPAPRRTRRQVAVQPQAQPRVEVHVSTPPARSYYQAPPVNPSYRALFETTRGGAKSCRPFDHEAMNMGACASYCSGLVIQKLSCRCSAGGC